MSKTIITSILTTLITLAAVAQPWLIFVLIWFAIGLATIYFIDYHLYPDYEKGHWLHYLTFGLLGIGAPIILAILDFDRIKSKFKFQSPIIKNEE